MSEPRFNLSNGDVDWHSDKTGGTVREMAGLDKVNLVDHIKITVASPEAIRSWSKEEIKKPETINYRTFKPEKGGLFCERIFGPVKDWECSCGKYKRVKHRGVVCDRCGVEVTLSRVRRERMGHIELATPVSHIWFYKCMPSRIGLMMDMAGKYLEQIIYYESYLVIDPGTTPLERHDLLIESQPSAKEADKVHNLKEVRDLYGWHFVKDPKLTSLKKDQRLSKEELEKERKHYGEQAFTVDPEVFVVVDPKRAKLERGQILTAAELQSEQEKYGEPAFDVVQSGYEVVDAKGTRLKLGRFLNEEELRVEIERHGRMAFNCTRKKAGYEVTEPRSSGLKRGQILSAQELKKAQVECGKDAFGVEISYEHKVTNPKLTKLKQGQVLSASELRAERERYGEAAFVVKRSGYEVVNPRRTNLEKGRFLTASELRVERVRYGRAAFVVEQRGYKVVEVKVKLNEEGKEPEVEELKRGEFLTEEELQAWREKYGREAFVSVLAAVEEKKTESENRVRYIELSEGGELVFQMGAEAVRESLSRIDLDAGIEAMHSDLEKTRSKQVRKKLTKRIKLFEGFQSSKARPEWMILTILPVIPPDLRPLVPLEGGRFATSDLNDLYRRVINRNSRLKDLLSLKTPEVIIRNEKRMLQEAVDALFDNGRHGRAVTGSGNRPLKSLSDMLKGKGGRFRQNLLGKRVDYSGRSVIVIGPELKLNQCGLPKKMALTLFEPFIIRRLKEQGYVHTVRSAKKLIESESPEVWDILEEVTRHHPVLLNRAPTLHRLSIQAFEPVLIEGSAIRIHPLVCTAFNADFDGDQMAVHVPLSVEAQMEARLLMMASNNIFGASNGRPIMVPTQDITLGVYYLTAEPRELGGVGRRRLKFFGSREEAIFAFEDGGISMHERIRLSNPDRGRETRYGDGESGVIETTVGRVIFSEIWPSELGFLNREFKKSEIGDLIWDCYKCFHERYGHNHIETLDSLRETLDRLKEIGFREATRAGVSMGMDDMIIPQERDGEIRSAEREVAKVETNYRRGMITAVERRNKIIDIWTVCTEKITDVMLDTLRRNQGKEEYNPICLMIDSGARGNRLQARQLAGLRGLMARASGDIIPQPVLASFRDGLPVLDYSITTYGARKGLTDTALKTADSGDMTRRLVNAAQDVIIREYDCGTSNGIAVGAVADLNVKLRDRLVGRVACEDVEHPKEEGVIVRAGEEIDERSINEIEEAGVSTVLVRSPLTCESKVGLCALCYGRNLESNRLASEGEAVGIIAAQSIGEPGTQLTMRTFHVGGVAKRGETQSEIQVRHGGRLVYQNIRAVELGGGSDLNRVVLNSNGMVWVMDEDGEELERYDIPYGAAIRGDGKVVKGAVIARWDPHHAPILSEKPGVVKFHEVNEGETVAWELDAATGKKEMVIVESKKGRHPQIMIQNSKGELLASYPLPPGARFSLKEGERTNAGTLLARVPREISKTEDITGGLPRVVELFEARRPNNAAEIAKIDGTVDFGGDVRGKRRIIIRDENTDKEEEHLIPIGRHVIVFKGDVVKRGDQLTEGPIDPHDILEVKGQKELQEHLRNEVQKIYHLQGVTINEKHIEVIIRQTLRMVRITEEEEKVRITSSGDTKFLRGDLVEKTVFKRGNDRVKEEGGRLAEGEFVIAGGAGDTKFLDGDLVEKFEFERENERMERLGGKPAEAVPVLLGIRKVSLLTESFLSAASFQDTTRILTEAATMGKKDFLRGFRENVIMGHIIPAGTGYKEHRDIRVKPLVEVPVVEESIGEEGAALKALGTD